MSKESRALKKANRARVQAYKAALSLSETRKISAGNGKTESRTPYGSRNSGDKYQGGTDDLLGEVNYDHTTLRGKSRKSVFDSPAVASLQNRKVQSVVDTGIRVEPTPDFMEIGMSEAQGAAFLKFAKGFNDWMNWKTQHRREQMNFFQAQHLAQREKERDGEYIFRAYYNYDDNLPHPLQWEALDSDQLPDYSATITQDGFLFQDTAEESKKLPVDGIVKDERGRPVEYLIWSKEKNGPVRVAAKTEKGRYQIIHGFSPEYAFQTRGFPSSSKILQDSHLLQDFSIAHINKAINQANRVFSVENKDRDPTSPFNEGDFTAALDQMFQDGTTPGTATPTEGAINYLNSPLWRTIALQTEPGGTSLIMPEQGTYVKSIDNTAPVQDYGIFVNAFFSFLAAAENIPVEVALMKFGQNYSASRAALVMFFRICEVERQDMDTDLISPFYEMYLAEGIAAGMVSAPGWADPRLRQYYLRHRTIGAPMISIDPARESVASLNNLGTGATSFSRNAQSVNGSDVEKNLSENEGLMQRVGTLRQWLGLNKSTPNG